MTLFSMGILDGVIPLKYWKIYTYALVQHLTKQKKQAYGNS